jgi:hypothetical protein
MNRKWSTTDIVAMILSISIGLALNIFIIGSVIEAYSNSITLPIGLSDNATQILGAWGGGIISVIGALVGVRIGRKLPPAESGNKDGQSS